MIRGRIIEELLVVVVIVVEVVKIVLIQNRELRSYTLNNDSIKCNK